MAVSYFSLIVGCHQNEAGTFVGGNTLAIDPLQVPCTLAFNFQTLM
jgi:hypothetical protein